MKIVIQHNDMNGAKKEKLFPRCWLLNTIIGSVCSALIISIRDALRLCFSRNTKYDLCGISRITMHSEGYILWKLLRKMKKKGPF
jgi:hypothetical protein